MSLHKAAHLQEIVKTILKVCEPTHTLGTAFTLVFFGLWSVFKVENALEVWTDEAAWIGFA